MKRLEHLLFILAEECAEVAHCASKAARFGPDEVEPGQEHTNMARIYQKFNDVCAVWRLLALEHKMPLGFNFDAIIAKQYEIQKYLSHSTLAAARRGNNAPPTPLP